MDGMRGPGAVNNANILCQNRPITVECRIYIIILDLSPSSYFTFRTPTTMFGVSLSMESLCLDKETGFNKTYVCITTIECCP